jgi:hypothetical protein
MCIGYNHFWPKAAEMYGTLHPGTEVAMHSASEDPGRIPLAGDALVLGFSNHQIWSIARKRAPTVSLYQPSKLGHRPRAGSYHRSSIEAGGGYRRFRQALLT